MVRLSPSAVVFWLLGGFLSYTLCGYVKLDEDKKETIHSEKHSPMELAEAGSVQLLTRPRVTWCKLDNE